MAVERVVRQKEITAEIIELAAGKTASRPTISNYLPAHATRGVFGPP
jgi:hypothetical protein